MITFPTLLTMIVAVTVKELCEFNDESRFDVNVPSLALQLGHSMKQCAQVLKKISFAKIIKMRLREENASTSLTSLRRSGP